MQQVAQCPLVVSAEPGEQRPSGEQPCFELRAQSLPCGSEGELFHPAIGLVGPALQQAAGVEAVHQAGDVGRVAVEALGQVAHGRRFSELEKQPGLWAGEPELGGDDLVVRCHLPGQAEDERRSLHFQLEPGQRRPPGGNSRDTECTRRLDRRRCCPVGSTLPPRADQFRSAPAMGSSAIARSAAKCRDSAPRPAAVRLSQVRGLRPTLPFATSR